MKIFVNLITTSRFIYTLILPILQMRISNRAFIINLIILTTFLFFQLLLILFFFFLASQKNLIMQLKFQLIVLQIVSVYALLK